MEPTILVSDPKTLPVNPADIGAHVSHADLVNLISVRGAEAIQAQIRVEDDRFRAADEAMRAALLDALQAAFWKAAATVLTSPVPLAMRDAGASVSVEEPKWDLVKDWIEILFLPVKVYHDSSRDHAATAALKAAYVGYFGPTPRPGAMLQVSVKYEAPYFGDRFSACSMAGSPDRASYMQFLTTAPLLNAPTHLIDEVEAIKARLSALHKKLARVEDPRQVQATLTERALAAGGVGSRINEILGRFI